MLLHTIFTSIITVHTVPVFHSEATHSICFQQNGTPNLQIEFEVNTLCTEHCDISTQQNQLSCSFLPLRFYHFQLIVLSETHSEHVFQLPRVCPFQELSYTITLQRVVGGDAAIVVGPIIVPLYSDQRLVPGQETIRNGLVMGARYSVVVSVNTSGGMSTSSQLSFVGEYIH